MALMMYEDCKEKNKKLGFIMPEEFAARGGVIPKQHPSIVKITSTPPGAQLWAGPDANSVTIKPGLTTPFERTHPKGGRTWNAECYRATADGYAPSETVCRNKEEGDRILHLTLTPLSPPEASNKP